MKVSLISCYFGELPEHFPHFLNSCKYNPSINWIIFTDDKQDFVYPENVKKITCSFDFFQELVKKKIGKWAICKKPYKICDYKPTFGLLFDELLTDSDYWGYCDIDVIWGDLEKFLRVPLEKKYDRILGYGHLALYKNTPNITNSFKLPFNGINYQYVFSHESNFGFDERSGMNKLFSEYNFTFWHEEVMIDIIRPYEDSSFNAYNQTNYRFQFFTWEKGRVFQNFKKNNSWAQKEFAYIHFQKRRFLIHDNNESMFQIGSLGIHLIANEVNEMVAKNSGDYPIMRKYINVYKDLFSSLNYNLHKLKNKILL